MATVVKIYTSKVCDTQANSPGFGRSTSDCVCNSGFNWDSALELCKRDCSGILNSDGNAVEKSYTDCMCNEGFAWDNSKGICNSPSNIGSSSSSTDSNGTLTGTTTAAASVTPVQLEGWGLFLIVLGSFLVGSKFFIILVILMAVIFLVYTHCKKDKGIHDATGL